MKNIALNQIPKYCTLNEFQHQSHVRVYRWLMLHAASQKLLPCNCNSVTNSRVKIFFNHVLL